MLQYPSSLLCQLEGNQCRNPRPAAGDQAGSPCLTLPTHISWRGKGWVWAKQRIIGCLAEALSVEPAELLRPPRDSVRRRPRFSVIQAQALSSPRTSPSTPAATSRSAAGRVRSRWSSGQSPLRPNDFPPYHRRRGMRRENDEAVSIIRPPGTKTGGRLNSDNSSEQTAGSQAAPAVSLNGSVIAQDCSICGGPRPAFVRDGSTGSLPNNPAAIPGILDKLDRQIYGHRTRPRRRMTRRHARFPMRPRR
jgi:hypothetical protein